jgi:phenylpyruvate tautomerase PptA (4-oxalocrotonate tautomerase family)
MPIVQIDMLEGRLSNKNVNIAQFWLSRKTPF